MHKIFRNISLLTLVIMLIVSLAACNAAKQPVVESQPTEAVAETAAVEPTEEIVVLSGSIDFWVYEPDPGKPESAAALEKLKTDFEAANPGTTINEESWLAKKVAVASISAYWG